MARDLRTWLNVLEGQGDLKRVSAPVSLNGEIAEICRRMRQRQATPVLFENIEGQRDRWCRRLFTGGLCRRDLLALTLGMPAGASTEEIIGLLKRRFREPIAPATVSGGPVKDHILRGEEINLYDIPVPVWHPGDGGPYINTMSAVVTRHPETGQHNLGQYRAMIVAKDRISSLLIPSKGWGTVYDWYQRAGRPMPVALVFGWDQSMVFSAGIPLPVGEYGVMGALTGEPVPLVKCETSDLMVPASAEIVIEGTISPDPASYEIEGPFGEGGFYSTPASRPVIQVECITHRDDPIYRGALTGVPGPGNANDEMWVIVGHGVPPILWNVFEQQDVPGVIDFDLGAVLAIMINKTYQGQARQIAAAVWGSKLGFNVGKIIVVTENNIDIHNPAAVQTAIARNVIPSRDIIVYPMQVGSYVDPALAFQSQDVMEYGTGLQEKCLIDATVDWTTHPRRGIWQGHRLPPESTDHFAGIAETVAAKWSAYGLD